MIMNMMYDSFGINEHGILTIAGVEYNKITEKFGTPVYVLDETKIRRQCNIYKESMNKNFKDGIVAFASKSLSFKQIYRIMKDENMHIDLVSSGELHTALSVGFPVGNSFFHGNNKTDSDIKTAVDAGVGYIVADCAEEVDAVNNYCGKTGLKQKILLRIAPGVDPHVHHKVTTATVDSKFGVAIQTGQAIELVGRILKCENLILYGVHCHLGSQILSVDPYLEEVDKLTKFISEIKLEYGHDIAMMNIGGGFGATYSESEQRLDIDSSLAVISARLRENCLKYNISEPAVVVEPGRSIVAEAGVTLYTAGALKKITGFKNYVSVDGSMSDNPRYALYESPYTVVCANRMNDEKIIVASIAGRCCESGDIIQQDVPLPEIKRGDIIAVLATGAYNYSMSMNYNRLPRPPIVMIKDGEMFLAVKGEDFNDVMRNDI